MFKTGQLVQVRADKDIWNGEWSGPMEVKCDSTGGGTTVIHPRHGAGRFDSLRLELVTSAVPLFRKGDKILIEYEVVKDEPQRVPGADRHVEVTYPGQRGTNAATRLAEMLATGSITRAPEPPYVPKPGDWFHFWRSRKGVYPPVRCIWIDDRGIVSENEAGERNYHAREGMIYSTKFDFVPA